MPEARSKEHWLLKDALSPAVTCVTLVELDGLGDGSLPEAAAKRVRGHLADCARCRPELALLHEFERASPRAAEAATVQWITTQLERRFAGAIAPPARKSEATVTPIRRWLPRRPMQVGFAIAASLLVAAVGIGINKSRPPGFEPPTGALVFRSGSLAVVSPAASLEAPPRDLRWQPWASASSYAVRVMEVDHEVLWSAETGQTAIALPDSVRAQVVPHKPLLWEVIARDSDGKALASSGIQKFQLKSPEGKEAHVKWNAFVTTTTRGGRTVATFALALLLSAIAFADTFAGLSLRVLNDSAPAGGSHQLKLSVTEPRPIIISQANIDYGAALGPVQGVLMPSDPASAGAAVVQGHSLRIRTVSPGGTLGLSTTAPAVVVTIAVPAGLAAGTTAALNLNPLTSFFDDASGKPYPLQVKQGTFHVQGTVSITDVLPGGGFLPTGSTVTLVGLGFQPGAPVEIDGVAVASSAFVDANHVQAVTAADAQLDGRRVRGTNPDRTRA